MSRTWRKIPMKSRKRTVAPRNSGGAVASTGPSPERRRPDSDHDGDAMHLAAELLEQVAAETEQEHDAGHDGAEVRQMLLQVATEEELAPDQLMPTVEMAERALRQITGPETEAGSADFDRAAAFLRTMLNAGAEGTSDPAKSLMVPDGRQRDTAIPFWRDNRNTGLREADHRRARRESRAGLADPESAETVRTGKGRRYTDKYGDYQF